MNTDEYLRSGAYLPAPLRDFHDQKEVFKTMHATISPENESLRQVVSWVSGQCYVIDCFLWFMARRGWTLQRSRANVEFRDLAADIELRRQQEAEAFQKYLAERLKADSSPNTVAPQHPRSFVSGRRTTTMNVGQ